MQLFTLSAFLIRVFTQAPSEFNGQTARAYILLKIGMPMAILLHVSVTVAALKVSAHPVVFWNCIAIPGYALSNYLLLKNKNLLFGFYFTLLEIPIHALLSSFALGMQSGLFLFALGPVAYVIFSPFHPYFPSNPLISLS